MAPKRKTHGDGTAVAGESANPEDGTVDLSVQFAPGDDRVESSAQFVPEGDRAIYLVAVRDNERAPYSVMEIDAAAVAGGEETPRARKIASLRGAERGMSFVAAHSKHGSWIVGVGGGLTGGTIIFDPSTLETIQGPRLLYPKKQPVLISHGGKVYALSRRPRLVPYVDFEPWFESFSFDRGVACIDHEYLPPPPFFPLLVDPFEWRCPIEIEVSSYAAVGSHILLSPQPKLKIGTYAFHVVNKRWEKVHADNLPFVGQAVPLGGSLFAACPMSTNGITASVSIFHMSIKAEEVSPSLSIQEFPVIASEEKIALPLICPLGKGSFCSIRLGTLWSSRSIPDIFKKVHIISTSFQMENIESILTACQHQDAAAKDLLVEIMKEHTQRFKAKGRFHLVDSEVPVVAALSM